MTLSWSEAASRSKSSPESGKGEERDGWEYNKKETQGQIGVKEDRGNAEHVREWTESNPGRDALRRGGRGRVKGNQPTEGLIMKTRQEIEGCPDCRFIQKERARQGSRKGRLRLRKVKTTYICRQLPWSKQHCVCAQEQLPLCMRL